MSLPTTGAAASRVMMENYQKAAICLNNIIALQCILKTEACTGVCASEAETRQKEREREREERREGGGSVF